MDITYQFWSNWKRNLPPVRDPRCVGMSQRTRRIRAVGLFHYYYYDHSWDLVDHRNCLRPPCHHHHHHRRWWRNHGEKGGSGRVAFPHYGETNARTDLGKQNNVVVVGEIGERMIESSRRMLSPSSRPTTNHGSCSLRNKWNKMAWDNRQVSKRKRAMSKH